MLNRWPSAGCSPLPISGLRGVPETWGCGTEGHGLVGMVVMGQQLDSMILEVFSNLNDSAIL